jgi:hypothetical protein
MNGYVIDHLPNRYFEMFLTTVWGAEMSFCFCFRLSLTERWGLVREIIREDHVEVE